jgi:hypothetical protein
VDFFPRGCHPNLTQMCHPNLKPDRDSARGLTPGTDKKGTRPESGGREAFPALDAERDPQRISAAPFLLRPLFPELRRTSRARPYCQCVLGLKPQAQSYSPFGTKNSIRSKYLSTFSKPPRCNPSRTRTTTRTRTIDTYEATGLSNPRSGRQ